MDIYERYRLEKEYLLEEEAQRFRDTGDGFSQAEYDARIKEICNRIGL